MLRRILLAAVAVGAFAVVPSVASAATVTVPASGPNGSNGPFYVDSGIYIPAGQSVTVTAAGTWTICGAPFCTVGPDGIPGDSNPLAEAPGVPGGTLIGSLGGGQQGTWFPIGSGPTVVNGGPAGGELLLATNDASLTLYGLCGYGPTEGCYGDNTGSVTATIAIVPTSKDQCKNGGWQSYTAANGTPFKNQGDCVSFVATGGRNAANG